VKILEIRGNLELQKRLRVMGITPGKVLRLVSIQPMRGPVTVDIKGRQVTLGRGMANKIMVEVME
jgi:ferrous iron transport protein A